MVVLILAAVLTLAPMQAWAECAWVLWIGSSKIKTEPIEAFESKAVCEASVAARIKAMNPREVIGPLVIPESGNDAWLVRCLPDTIDPRGPKGGGR